MSEAMSRYMTTVLKYPLLTKEQEILLARQVQAWVTAENPDKKTVRIGRKAYEKLINCNLRLVISVARRYTNRCKLTEMLDIVQEGNIGLSHGVKKFDPERGYALSTYVYWWIRQAITRYLSTNDRLIKLPSHAVDMLAKMRSWTPLFQEEHGRAPTLEECAEFCGTNPRRMADYLERATDAGSLDRIVSDDSDMALIDCVSYDNDIMEELENNYDRERIGRMLDMLPWEEASLIRDFYGIDRTERITFNEMGKRQGVSRERMRQKFNRAIMKLRTIYSKQTRGGLSGEV